MKTLKKISLIVCSFFVISLLYAQGGDDGLNQQEKTAYSEDQLETFVEASKNINGVQIKAEEKMIAVIEKENLDIDRFNQIAEAHHDNNNVENDFTDEELESFQKAVNEIIRIQGEMQAEMEEAIEETGMEVTEYQEIMLAYQQDMELQNKINSMLEEE